MFDICITLVNTKEKKEIQTALETLAVDSVNSGLNWQVAVVDNASGDGLETELKAKFPNAVYIQQNKNLGFGASHNKALSAVEAKYYFVLNPDTEFMLGQNFLRRLYDFMEANSHVGMAGPKIIYPDGSLQYSCWRFPTFLQPIFSRTKWGRVGKGKIIADCFLMKDFDHASTKPVDAIMGSAMFVRREAYLAVGGFDDLFWMYFEDMDWCKRMWEKNWAVYFVHDVVLKHAHGRASAKVPGVVMALIKNKYARVHLVSWLKYFWKWRGNHKYYAN
ncbi:MAG TPA: glycosyltransferase family 2 protein [Candidatus Magasanikbacteria bacterium]|nr:glycosyltransferase family 2 protein [Candidatus Magasanikbacteria bacterium]